MRKTKRTKRNFTNRLGPYTNTHPNLPRGCQWHTRPWVGCRYCETNQTGRDRVDR
jgi:hypothetical protein